MDYVSPKERERLAYPTVSFVLYIRSQHISYEKRFVANTQAPYKNALYN